MNGGYIQRLKHHPVGVVFAVVSVLVAVIGGLSLRGRPPTIPPPGGDACAAPGGSVAARAYGLALTNPTRLGAFARDNATLFAEDGDAVTCSRLLAAALASNTHLEQLDALRDRAEAEREIGLEFDRLSYTTDLAETTQELADALPGLANGDDGPYRATKAYESAQAYSTLLQRAPGAAEGIDTLIQADEGVLRALAARLSGR